MKLDKRSEWRSDSFISSHLTKHDGKELKIQEDRVLFVAYFFLDDVRVEHIRRLYNVLNIVTEFGGLGAVLVCILGYAAYKINKEQTMKQMVSNLNFVKLTDNKASSPKSHSQG